MERHAATATPFDGKPERRGRPANIREVLSDDLLGAAYARSTEYSIHDDQIDGLFARVRSNGTKSFYLRPRLGGRTRPVALGTFPQISVEQARQMARERLTGMEGRHRASNFAAPAGEKTVRRLFGEYITLHKFKSEEWPEKVKRTFGRSVLPAIGNLKFRELTIEQIESICGDAGSLDARSQTRYMISAFVAWTVQTGRYSHNILKAWPAKSRPAQRYKRNLSIKDLVRIWICSSTLRAPWQTVVQLTLLRGIPVRELLALTKSAAMASERGDIENREWVFGPNGNRILSGMAKPEGQYIFGAKTGDRPRAFQQGILHELQEACGLGKFTMRDICGAVKRQIGAKGGRFLEWDERLLSLVHEHQSYGEVDL